MISPLRMLALDSDVCPTPVTYTVAPLNTYTFLKRGTDGADLCSHEAVGNGRRAKVICYGTDTAPF